MYKRSRCGGGNLTLASIPTIMPVAEAPDRATLSGNRRDTVHMKFRPLFTIISFVPAAVVIFTGFADGKEKRPFDVIKADLRSAVMTEVMFTNIVISDFFDTADTLVGSVVFDRDGRYATTLGSDKFIFTGECLWQYSAEYKQASRNCLKPGQRVDESFLFFPRFDELYQSVERVRDAEYILRLRPGKRGAGPDSMTVYLDQAKQNIARIEFLDINDEINRVEIESLRRFEAVQDARFIPDFPDSTEIIETP